MDNSTSWVVYVMTMHNAEGRRAVCEQSEWEQMERDRPGYHTLVQSGITSEAEAEKLARGTAGDSRLSATSKRRRGNRLASQSPRAGVLSARAGRLSAAASRLNPQLQQIRALARLVINDEDRRSPSPSSR